MTEPGKPEAAGSHNEALIDFPVILTVGRMPPLFPCQPKGRPPLSDVPVSRSLDVIVANRILLNSLPFLEFAAFRRAVMFYSTTSVVYSQMCD